MICDEQFASMLQPLTGSRSHSVVAAEQTPYDKSCISCIDYKPYYGETETNWFG